MLRGEQINMIYSWMYNKFV